MQVRDPSFSFDSVVVVVFQRITIIQRNSLLLGDFIFVCFFTATIPIFLKFQIIFKWSALHFDIQKIKITLAVFMLETLKLSKMLKSSRDDFNVLDNFNVSSIKTAIYILPFNLCAHTFKNP